MAKTGVRITGHPLLNMKLKQLEPKLQKKFARKALRNAGKMVRDSAKQNIASNDTIDSGELLKGIKVRAAKRSRSKIGIDVVTTEQERFSHSGKSGNFGGAQIEFGKRGYRAHPFLRPAIYGIRNRIKINMLVARDINEQIKEMSVKVP